MLQSVLLVGIDLLVRWFSGERYSMRGLENLRGSVGGFVVITSVFLTALVLVPVLHFKMGGVSLKNF